MIITRETPEAPRDYKGQAQKIGGLEASKRQQSLMKKAEAEQMHVLASIKYDHFRKKRADEQRQERRNKR